MEPVKTTAARRWGRWLGGNMGIGLGLLIDDVADRPGESDL